MFRICLDIIAVTVIPGDDHFKSLIVYSSISVNSKMGALTKMEIGFSHLHGVYFCCTFLNFCIIGFHNVIVMH